MTADEEVGRSPPMLRAVLGMVSTGGARSRTSHTSRRAPSESRAGPGHRPLDADVAAHLEWWSHQREVSVADAAPPLTHPDLVMGIRTLTVAHEWSAAELTSVAFLLFESNVLTVEEASSLVRWLRRG